MSDAQTKVKASENHRLKKPKTGGRAPKVTEDKVIAVANLIAIGMPEIYACARVKVNYAGFKTACERNGKYREIVVERQAEFLHNAVQDIASKETGNVRQRGLIWLLERRHRADFGSQGLEVTTNVNMSFSGEQQKELESMARTQFAIKTR